MHRREFLHRLTAAALLLHGVDTRAAVSVATGELSAGLAADEGVRDQLWRTQLPDLHYRNDIFIDEVQRPTLRQLQQRLGRLQRQVGHGNFSLIGVDEMRGYARNYPAVGELTASELALMEQLFYTDAGSYGFYGEKPLPTLTANIERRAIYRQQGSTQYLFKGEAQEIYQRIQQALGDGLVLTSGVRGVVKQMYLFMSKALEFEGNLSLASRSLAPPGYSFHGVGDFDVGKRGWGARNFTPDFAATDEFRRLQELGYIAMRYPQENQLGVRYEPWHIKVISI